MLSIRGRLFLLVALLALAMLLVGMIGVNTALTAEAEVKNIFDHQTVPMRELARVRRLTLENAGELFRAIQHNPAFEYARLHNHSLETHLDVVEKNMKWMDETLLSLRRGLLPGSEEIRMLDEFEPLYRTYGNRVLKPAVQALRDGNYSSEMVGGFLKENGAFEKQINPLLRAMAEAQQKSVQTTYEQSVARNERMRLVSLTALIGGLSVGLGLAFWIIASIAGPLRQMQSLIVFTAREKDFTGQLPIQNRDEIGQTAEAFNDLMAALRASFSQTKQSVLRVSESTQALAAASGQAARASSETSESAASMAASVEELSVSITSVSDHTREALKIANVAGEHSEAGGAVIGNAVASMGEIANQVRRVGGTITELGEHSDRISSVVQVIKDVADQTNLLALNAAIEAARAGEQGRGFAVVADEVRKLAERTTKATGEIAGMVNDIQERSRGAVSAMDDTIHRIEQGAELAVQAGQAIEAIRAANGEVRRVFADIDDAMREQGAASYDIAQRVERVARASEQSSASVEQAAEQATSIRALADGVRGTMDSFRV